MEVDEPKQQLQVIWPRPVDIFPRYGREINWCPHPRSGHRCYTDDDYLYVIGGYTKSFKGAMLIEFWAFNLTTRCWRRYQPQGPFPKQLASFTISQISHHKKNVLLFGGSHEMFGESSSNDCYLLQPDNENCIIHVTQLDVTGTLPEPKYGHTMCQGEAENKFYVVGGTTGNVFNMDIHSLQYDILRSEDGQNHSLEWKWEQLTVRDAVEGRYKHETIYDEVSKLLLFFGGSRNVESFGFESIDALDITTHQCVKFRTFPDGNRFPHPRRSFSMERSGRDVIIIGGASDAVVNRRRRITMHKDIWILNLDTRTWREHYSELAIPVFFHHSAITSDNTLLVVGGVIDTNTESRTNAVQMICLEPLKLRKIAVDQLRESYPERFEGLFAETLLESKDFSDIRHCFLTPGYQLEKSREIDNVPFIETEMGTRHFDNGNNSQFFRKMNDDFQDYSATGASEARTLATTYVRERKVIELSRLRAVYGLDQAPREERDVIVEDAIRSGFRLLRKIVWRIENLIGIEHFMATDPDLEDLSFSIEIDRTYVLRYNQLMFAIYYPLHPLFMERYSGPLREPPEHLPDRPESLIEIAEVEVFNSIVTARTELADLIAQQGENKDPALTRNILIARNQLQRAVQDIFRGEHIPRMRQVAQNMDYVQAIMSLPEIDDEPGD